MKKVMFLSVLVVGFLNSSWAQEIVLGQSVALSGPAKSLGVGMQTGAMTFFKDKKDVKLITVDDKYEPVSCKANTEKFIQDNVTALFGYVGTPTSKVAVPLAMKANKVYFGAFTGAGFLSDTVKNPYSFSVRASYCMETDKMVNSLVAKGIKKIAIFVQDDSFGDVGKNCTVKSLKKHNLKFVEEGRYPRNTIAVKRGADKVLKSRPGAVILVGAYRPCGTAIKYWKKKGLNVPFVNISFVGSKALAKELKSNFNNVYITQVVPDPWNSNKMIVKEYRSKTKKEDVGLIGLEGYITAKTLYKALSTVGNGHNDSKKLKAAIEAINDYDIGGIKISFSKDDHRALNRVYLSKIEADQKIKYVNGIK